MEELSYQGEWWLPSDADARCTGTLEYTHSKGLRLVLTGSSGQLLQPEQSASHEIILGLAEKAGEVTLWRSSCLGVSQREFPQEKFLFQAQYQPSVAYFGTHLTDYIANDEPSFSGVAVGFSGLQEWLLRSGFDNSNEDDVDVLIKYKNPEAIRASIDTCTVTVQFGFSASFSYGQFSESVKQSVTVAFERDKNWSLTVWLQKVVIPFQEFLTFVTGVPSQIMSSDVRLPDYDNRLAGNDRYEKAVYWPWRMIAVASDPDRGLKQFGLVPSSIALTRWQEMLTRWFVLRTELDSVINLYLASKFHEKAYPFSEAEFLNAAQAIESFHGRRRHEKAIDDETSAALIEVAKNAVPHEYRIRVEQLLKRIGEMTFIERLRKIFDEQSALLDGLVDNLRRLARRVTDTRNYLVHFNPRLANKSLTGLEMVDACDTLWVIVECLLLEELGFNREESTQLVRRTNRYRRIGERTEVLYF